MKHFVAEHLSVILQVVIFGSVLFLLFCNAAGKGNAMQRLSQAVPPLANLLGKQTDLREVETYAYLSPPEITMLEFGHCYAGDTYASKDCFSAKSGVDGKPIPFKIQRIQKEENGKETDCKSQVYDSKEETLCFPTSGVYHVYLYAKDENQKTARRMISVAVNRRNL